MRKYSVIIPVYNRPKEVIELLESLLQQTYTNFELIIIEDGSTESCEDIAQHYASVLDIKYFYKENSGPGDSRNVGMSKATGDYLVFFDSDCIIPSDYFQHVEDHLDEYPLDAYGGPDAASASFSNIQKAINHAMTSVITTGGVRGKKNSLDKFYPRSFNMGFSRAVYEKTGGFGDIHPGEDPDLSYRIMANGFRVGLIEKAFVYHKRRIDFQKFAKQVYKFGIVRPILIKWYPDNFKLTYTFPTLFLLGSLFLVAMAMLVSVWCLLPLGMIALIVFLEALLKTKSLWIAVLAVLASFVQLYCYGFGFLKSAFYVLVLGREERSVFESYFFDE